MRRAALHTGLLLALMAPAGAQAADRWVVTGRSTLPPQYWQGVAFDRSGDGLFAGPLVGLYRTDAALRERARVDTGIVAGEPFNHIGDIEWDAREGGRLLLPLECYDPAQDPSNFCGIGGVGVTDPITFARRYTVQLAGVPKTMWLALGPDGRLWTQAGSDLLAFDAGAIVASAAAAPISPVRTLPGAFDGQANGAAVLGGRLYFTRQASDAIQQLWSLDLATGGDRRLEATQRVRGESEGLAALDGLGGTLHWVIAPGVADPTYGGNSVLVHLKRRGTRTPSGVQRLSAIRVSVTTRRPHAGRKVTLRLRATARVAGTTVRMAGGHVRAGRHKAVLDAAGAATIRLRAPRHGCLTVRVSRPAFRDGVVRLRVRR